MRAHEVVPVLQRLDLFYLSFTVDLKKEGEVWESLDQQVQRKLQVANVMISIPPIGESPSPQSTFHALPWKLVAPTSTQPTANRRFTISTLCHYDFTVSKLEDVAKKVKNPMASTPMLFLSALNSLFL